MNDDHALIVCSEQTRAAAMEAVRRLPVRAGLSYRMTLELIDAPHTNLQRIGVFSRCKEIAEQGVTFPGGGEADAKSWYRFLIGLHRALPMVREGQVVVILGAGLSGATRSEASDLITFIEAYGTERGVTFREREQRR